MALTDSSFRLPDLSDPHYLHEVGWFLLQQKHKDLYDGGGYEAYRPEHSDIIKDEMLTLLGESEKWRVLKPEGPSLSQCRSRRQADTRRTESLLARSGRGDDRRALRDCGSLGWTQTACGVERLELSLPSSQDWKQGAVPRQGRGDRRVREVA
jgi:hypothetical protein